MKNTTKRFLFIRYSRIIKHYLQFIFTGNLIYKYEVDHYYYMRTFIVKIKTN